jgi:hypothetical protein
MNRRFIAVAVTGALTAFASQVYAADPEFKWGATQPTTPQSTISTNVSAGNIVPLALPNLDYSSAMKSSSIPPASVALFSTTKLNALTNSTSRFGANLPSTTTSNRVDLGMNGVINIPTSAVGQFANANPSVTNKLLATPSLLRDSGFDMGISQAVPPSQYLNDSHQFLNR